MTETADLVRPSDARLERVLDAAAELLLRWGYQKVTIDEIARHARIGKGTVYLHFPTKDALFLAVYEHGTARIRADHAVFADDATWRDLPADDVVVQAVRDVVFGSSAAERNDARGIAGPWPLGPG